jgi:hypothetical protein
LPSCAASRLEFCALSAVDDGAGNGCRINQPNIIPHRLAGLDTASRVYPTCGA